MFDLQYYSVKTIWQRKDRIVVCNRLLPSYYIYKTQANKNIKKA